MSVRRYVCRRRQRRQAEGAAVKQSGEGEDTLQVGRQRFPADVEAGAHRAVADAVGQAIAGRLQAPHHACQAAPRRGKDALGGNLYRQRQAAQYGAQCDRRLPLSSQPSVHPGNAPAGAGCRPSRARAARRIWVVRAATSARSRVVISTGQLAAPGSSRSISRPATAESSTIKARRVGQDIAHGGGACFGAADLAQVFVVGECPALQDIERLVFSRVCPEHTVGKLPAQLVGKLDGQGRLARAPHADDGGDPPALRLRQPGDQPGTLLVAAHKVAGDRRCLEGCLGGISGSGLRRAARRPHLARHDLVVEGIRFRRGRHAQLVQQRGRALVVLLERGRTLPGQGEQPHLEPVHLFAFRFIGQQLCAGGDAQVDALLRMRRRLRQPVQRLAPGTLPAAALCLQPFDKERRPGLDCRLDTFQKSARPKAQRRRQAVPPWHGGLRSVRRTGPGRYGSFGD